MKKQPFKRVVEEFCMQEDCPREGSHWHPLSVESLAAEEIGEYTITVRVREVKGHRKAQDR